MLVLQYKQGNPIYENIACSSCKDVYTGTHAATNSTTFTRATIQPDGQAFAGARSNAGLVTYNWNGSTYVENQVLSVPSDIIYHGRQGSGTAWGGSAWSYGGSGGNGILLGGAWFTDYNPNANGSGRVGRAGCVKVYQGDMAAGTLAEGGLLWSPLGQQFGAQFGEGGGVTQNGRLFCIVEPRGSNDGGYFHWYESPGTYLGSQTLYGQSGDELGSWGFGLDEDGEWMAVGTLAGVGASGGFRIYKRTTDDPPTYTLFQELRDKPNLPGQGADPISSIDGSNLSWYYDSNNSYFGRDCYLSPDAKFLFVGAQLANTGGGQIQGSMSHVFIYSRDSVNDQFEQVCLRWDTSWIQSYGSRQDAHAIAASPSNGLHLVSMGTARQDSNNAGYTATKFVAC